MNPELLVVHCIDDLSHAKEALSRRGFLKAGMATASGIATLLTLGCSKQEEALPQGFESLLPQHIKVFRHLTKVLFPISHSSLLNPAQIPVVENIDRMLSGLDAELLKDLHGLIDLFNYGPYITEFKFRSFVELSEAEALDYLESWQNDGIFVQRAIVSTFKKFVYASYWREDQTWPAVEFDGPVSKAWQLQPLGNAPLPS